MKKNVIALSLALMMAFPLAACQAMPEQDIVVKKDAERMVVQAGMRGNGMSVAELRAAETHADYESAELDGMLNITVDADVKTPDADAMPIIKVSQGLFTQEQVTGMFNYLFTNEKPRIQFGQVETKADIEREISRLEKQYANGEFGGTEEEYKKQLDLLEQIYQEAPETAESDGGISDGTMSKNRLMSKDGEWLELHVASDHFQLWAHTLTTKQLDLGEGHASDMAALQYRCTDTDRMYTNRNTVITDGTNLPEAAAKSLTITFDEAQALCNGFFQAAGYPADTFHVGPTYIVDDTGADEIPGTNFAFQFIYHRVASGIPLYDNYNRCIHGIENASVKEDAASISWRYEYIEFTVDREGIASIVWHSPIDIDTIAEDNAALKPFDDIMDVFKDMTKASGAAAVQDILGGEVSLAIDADKAELMLVRIRDQGGNPTDGLLVPAWVFYGYCMGTGKDGAGRYINKSVTDLLSWKPVGGPESGVAVEGGGILSVLDQFNLYPEKQEEHRVLLVVNAVDGSIIDLSRGY